MQRIRVSVILTNTTIAIPKCLHWAKTHTSRINPAINERPSAAGPGTERAHPD